MNFGGPVWHASGRGRAPGTSYGIADRALLGVGDAARGEWVERGRGGVVHIRRRLSLPEQSIVGDAIDIRGTDEERQRLRALFRAAPYLAEILPVRPSLRKAQFAAPSPEEDDRGR